MPTLKFTYSATVLLQYLMRRLGINLVRLQRDFAQQYQLASIKNILPTAQGYQVTTQLYRITTTRYGRIQHIEHLSRASKIRRPRPKKRPTPSRVKPRMARATQPNNIRHDSAIIQRIQNEHPQPRVFIKRRRKLEIPQ